MPFYRADHRHNPSASMYASLSSLLVQLLYPFNAADWRPTLSPFKSERVQTEFDSFDG